MNLRILKTDKKQKPIFYNKIIFRKVAQCCENYEMNPETNECEPICMRSCENFGACVAPDTCKCDYGYQGKYCEIGKWSGKFNVD